ncbi:putative thiopurine S-methyltransferase [Gastrophryne carolinensis]
MGPARTKKSTSPNTIFMASVLSPTPTMDECTETIQTRIFTEDNWKRNWEIGKIVFHEKEKHPLLVEFLDEMINGRQKLNIFFPLCGKNVDMKWLAEKGHTIVGVDISEIGLKQFFEEQSVPFVEEAVPDIPGAKVFKSTSENISLYCCSIYQISDSVIGKFDGIWDRGSLVAINLIERQRYVDIMLSLLNQDCRYLLITVDFNPALIQGPL